MNFTERQKEIIKLIFNNKISNIQTFQNDISKLRIKTKHANKATNIFKNIPNNHILFFSTKYDLIENPVEPLNNKIANKSKAIVNTCNLCYNNGFIVPS